MSDVLAFDCLHLNWWQKSCRALIVNQIEKLTGDRLLLIDNYDQLSIGDQAGEIPPIRIIVHNPRFYARVLAGGPLGAAESLMDGDWTCSDLSRLVRMMLKNEWILNNLDGGFSSFKRAIERFRHWIRRNTVKRSRSNIREHYDLGNDFFFVVPRSDNELFQCLV